MKRVFFISWFLVAALVLVSCSKTEEQLPSRTQARGVAAPNFSLKDLEGRSVSLSSFKDKSPVLMFFWATWCGYCREEIPKVADLRNRFDTEALAILGIDLQEPSARVGRFAKTAGINYTVLLDEDASVAMEYGVFAVPSFFLVDKEGQVVAHGNRLTPQMLALIQAEV